MEAWENFLNQEEADLGAETIDKWLRSLKILRFDACNLYLEAKDSFTALWFEEHIRRRVLLKLYNNNKKPIKVHLAIASQETKAPKQQKSKSKVQASPEVNQFSLTFDTFDPHCTFDSFILCPSNELAVRLLTELSNNPNNVDSALDPTSNCYNPIYIYGSRGTGKTHLLTAIGDVLKKKGLKVIYSRAETFTEHVITAIRAGEMSFFRNAYRNIDVLLIDDVQVFSRKAATQEEFFHTFNTLHLAGKQIILTANCAPSALESIEPRLISRFEWGIALPLESQNRDELALIIQRKAEALNYKLSSKLSNFLLDTFKSGARALMKALQALILRTHLSDSERALPFPSISIPQATAILQDLIAEEQKATLTPDKILLHVSEQFGIRPEDILQKKQSREYVLPRQIAMYICRMELKLPFTKIGALFSKDHSTVMSSVKLIQSALANNQNEIAAPMHLIKKRIKA